MDSQALMVSKVTRACLDSLAKGVPLANLDRVMFRVPRVTEGSQVLQVFPEGMDSLVPKGRMASQVLWEKRESEDSTVHQACLAFKGFQDFQDKTGCLVLRVPRETRVMQVTQDTLVLLASRAMLEFLDCRVLMVFLECLVLGVRRENRGLLTS